MRGRPWTGSSTTLYFTEAAETDPAAHQAGANAYLKSDVYRLSASKVSTLS